MSQRPKKTPLLGTHISTGTFEEFVENVASLKARRGSGYTCCTNVHMVIEGHQDPAFQRVVNEADYATPDGSPLRHAIKLLNGLDQERVAGPDLMPALLTRAQRTGERIFFYGDTDEVLAALVAKVKKNHPGIQIAGSFSPPFRAISPEEDQAIVDQINATNPDILFVALGCPKQENWMAAHRGRVMASMVGVGYAFRTYAGLADRAPEWMQRYSLEWLFRLLQNPRRLWKRYLVTNSIFAWLLLKTWLRNKLSPQKDMVSAS